MARALTRLIAAAAMTVALAAGAGAAPDARPSDADRDAVRAVIVAQMEAFLADDAEGAYAFAAPSIRSMFPTAEVFMRMVRRGYRPVYRARDPLFTRSRLLEEGRIVQEVSLTGPDGGGWTAVYTLERQADGDWKITGCYLREASGEAV